jgi:hypothetical protein
MLPDLQIRSRVGSTGLVDFLKLRCLLLLLLYAIFTQSLLVYLIYAVFTKADYVGYVSINQFHRGIISRIRIFTDRSHQRTLWASRLLRPMIPNDSSRQ